MSSEWSRRIIYLLMIAAVSYPILSGFTTTPSRLVAADRMFNVIDSLQPKPNQFALVAMEFGPSIQAENGPQAEVLLEHLMRKRIPVAVFSTIPISEPFLTSVPKKVVERLNREAAPEVWEYGRDWINLGYRPGDIIFIQGMAQSDNLASYLGKDASGVEVTTFPNFSAARSVRDIMLVAEFTGFVGAFEKYVQFMKRDGYAPPLVHGCTSITIPQSYIYLDSGQLQGLLEGVSGAAWYSQLLKQKYPNRSPDAALLINTSLGVAHLVIIALIIAGNVILLWRKFLPVRA